MPNIGTIAIIKVDGFTLTLKIQDYRLNMHKLLLKNPLLFTPESIIRKDLLIEGNFIAKIDDSISADGADTVLDCHELLVIPGLIDEHVHFREPGMESKGTIKSESRAAVLGGVTSYLDMPNNNPATCTLQDISDKKQRAKKDSLANFGFYLGANRTNLDEIRNANIREIAGIKVFMGSSTGNMLLEDDNLLYDIFLKAKTLIALHCEDPGIVAANEERIRKQYADRAPIFLHPYIRNRDCCLKSTQKAIALALETGARIHIMHISTKEEVELLKKYMFGNVITRQISGEACVPHLFFNESDYAQKGGLIKCNPAIKFEQDRRALISGLEEHILTTIGTDHAPHELEKKGSTYFQCASGMPSVQYALQCLLELYKRQERSLETIINAYSTHVAERYHIEKRGRIAEGMYADLAVLDLGGTHLVNKEDIASLCKWSPFTGSVFHSLVKHTIVNGNIVVRDGRIIAQNGGEALVFDR